MIVSHNADKFLREHLQGVLAHGCPPWSPFPTAQACSDAEHHDGRVEGTNGSLRMARKKPVWERMGATRYALQRRDPNLLKFLPTDIN